MPRIIRSMRRCERRPLFERSLAMIAAAEAEGLAKVLGSGHGFVRVSWHDGPDEVEAVVTDPFFIDREFFDDRLTVDEACGLDRERVLDFLESLDKRMCMTLEAVVISQGMGLGFDGAADIRDDPLGICLDCPGIVAIDIDAIEDAVAERFRNASRLMMRKEIERELAITLAHEVRHLAQANPWLPADALRQGRRDEEADAEDYAVRFCGRRRPAGMLLESEDVDPASGKCRMRTGKRPWKRPGKAGAPSLAAKRKNEITKLQGGAR